MMEEFLYWCVVFERWFVNENWEKLKDAYFSSIPTFIRPIATSIIRKKMRKAAIGHGIGRHSMEQVHLFGVEGIESLASFLDDKNFLLGDKVTSFDSSCYAFLSNLLFRDLNPRLMEVAEDFQHLREYCSRMHCFLK